LSRARCVANFQTILISGRKPEHRLRAARTSTPLNRPPRDDLRGRLTPNIQKGTSI
jgi:hypothetical protein